MTSRYEGEPRGPQSDTSRTSEPTPDRLMEVKLKSGDKLSIGYFGRAESSLAAALAETKNRPFEVILNDCQAVLRVDSSGNLELTLLDDWDSLLSRTVHS